MLYFVLEKSQLGNASHQGICTQGFSAGLLQCMQAFGN